MRIIIAMDSFKGSLSAQEACEAAADGMKRVIDADIHCLPVADGGEGTVDAVVSAARGTKRKVDTTDPLGRQITAEYGVLPDGTVVIETAAASGLTLLRHDERDAKRASSYGTGTLIRDAIEHGARRIMLGLGGSATTDGGTGLARALGVRYIDAEGKDLGHGGASLAELAEIDASDVMPELKECTFVAAVDVKNILCGPEGAAAVFGPQKGASPKDVEILDSALARMANVLRTSLGCAIADEPGSGAAGGMICGLAPFTSTQTRPGIELVLDLGGFDSLAAEADLVITGEGRVDAQSAYGKVPVGVARRAKAVRAVPVAAIGGCIGAGADTLYDHGIDAIVSCVAAPCTLDDAMGTARGNLTAAAERLMRTLRAGQMIQK